MLARLTMCLRNAVAAANPKKSWQQKLNEQFARNLAASRERHDSAAALATAWAADLRRDEIARAVRLLGGRRENDMLVFDNVPEGFKGVIVGGFSSPTPPGGVVSVDTQVVEIKE